MNPPYGDQLPQWCAKISYEAQVGTPLLALLPCGARFSTSYWQDHILCSRLNALCFIRGRVAFLDKDGQPQSGNPYDSAIYAYNVSGGRFHESFNMLGKVLLVREAHE